MHNQAPFLENDTHKLLWDFDIHTDHLISANDRQLMTANDRPDLMTINKIREFAKL